MRATWALLESGDKNGRIQRVLRVFQFALDGRHHAQRPADAIEDLIIRAADRGKWIPIRNNEDRGCANSERASAMSITKVTGFKAVVKKGKVKIAWKAVLAATSYRVRICLTGQWPAVLTATGTPGSQQYAFPSAHWSEHFKPATGTELCEAPHFQYVISGTLGTRMADGTEIEARAGDVNVLPPGHDGWVIGDEPAVVVDWGGAHARGRAASDQPV